MSILASGPSSVMSPDSEEPLSSSTLFVKTMSLYAVAIGLICIALAVSMSGGGTPARAFASTIVEEPGASSTLGIEATSVVALGEPLSAARRLGAVVASAPTETRTPLLVPAKKRAVVKKVAPRRSDRTDKPWAGPWRRATVSWYGPGFYGRHTANGTTLTRSSVNVAHKTLPFGTRVQFKYRNRLVIAVVNDRGPFVRGREFDLGPGTARALGFDGVDTVSYRIINKR